MMRMILTPLVVGGLIIVMAASAQAVTTTRYPYCLQGRSSPGWSNCNFASWSQCHAKAAGRRLTCVKNPFYRARGR
jgi:hypothetical protein